MPALQVRDFPDDLYEMLKASAKANHRSLAQQTVAFVERGLRDERLSARYGGAYDMGIAPSAHEAAMRARLVNPFNPFVGTGLEIEPEEVIEARKEKRRRLRKRIAELNAKWDGPKPTTEEVVQMIREDRDHRGDDVMADIEEHLEARRRESNDSA